MTNRAERMTEIKMKKLEFHPSQPSPFIISLKAEGCEG